MAYQIDFTASNYVNRARRKTVLRLLLLGAIAGAVWGVHDVYTTYNLPTLNMRLADYEAVARPIEEMNAKWDEAAKEYAAMARYYRLLWAASPTNFLAVMTSGDAPRLGRGSHPVRWTLKTGGPCQLEFRHVFAPGDKASQTAGLEAEIVQAVTSRVAVAGGAVDVKGVRHENLLKVDSLGITVGFSLPDALTFPTKEPTLANCVSEIAAVRKRVLESRFAEKSDTRGVQPTAQAIMMAYLSIGRDKPDFPNPTEAIDVSGWFGRADRFIAKNRIPGDEAARRGLKTRWNKIGEARFPWDRFRILDNDALVQRTKALETVADGVKRFKVFLEKCQADCRAKLEPFVEAYDCDDIFNKPLVESDLKGRVAAAAGLPQAVVKFENEPGVEPVVLVKDDEKFTFTWVRWTLSIGVQGDARRQSERTADAEAPVTLARLADCVQRVLTLGPGYALDTLEVDFDADRNVSGAVLEGLLPVKKVEFVGKRQ